MEYMRYFTTYLIYMAVVARAIGWNQETAPIPTTIWILLGIIGLILVSQQVLSRRSAIPLRWYTFILSILTIITLYVDPTLDFLSLLFLPLSFQAVQVFHARIGFAWIGGFSLALVGRLFLGLEWEAGLTNVVAGSAANVMMGSFAHLITRNEQRQQENQRLFGDLQEAYSQLKDSAEQAEELAAANERHRLVRELHDSLTQTLFSMNLAVQSAQLSIDEDLPQAEEHLLRLQSLTRSAASEVQDFLGRAPYRSIFQGGLVEAMRHLAEERLAQDGLQVTLEATGRRDFPQLVEENLYRITQEALNNVTRHARVRQALVRLRLDEPLACLEIIDEGCGFNLTDTQQAHSFGLAGMVERAREINWELEIESQPGLGTHIRLVEKAK
jgi:signal transduction histidine kinase